MQTVPGPTDYVWRQGLIIALMGAGFSQKEVARRLGPTEKTIRTITQRRGLQWVAHHGRRGPMPEIPQEVKNFLAYVARVEATLPHKRPPDIPSAAPVPASNSPNLSYTSLLQTNGDRPLQFEI